MTSHPREWIYIGLVVAALFGLHGLRRVFWAFSLLVLPGTFAHEALHFLSGLLLNGGPVSFNLLPRREGTGWAMGSVSFNHLRWYNAFFIGMAPLLLLPAAYGLVVWRLRGVPVFGWREALAVYLIANLVYAALPSWQDVRIAARSPIGWLLLAAGLGWGWHALQVGAPPAQVRAR
ncbi:hypothetical protein [Mesoterricola silvestris]|uniref:Uncharacterized protein n=1 Tax=Mesoterricola silvestris TaxID=2927979 RepID=A0AA48GHH9_9BACT|nr:hypothetical protein [Mesoterricola silvestris]BDU72971.1 hypothetical protein METEAL_21450 [Mesoterricola silvestris]